ncbi:hypothetical protein [Chroococcidiopsis sp.]|uniref:hypothetical protein n=1 Tax=Chroococcidiopsis sp. TaxID=3088168 RepID=UPI003F30CA01
MRTKNISVTYGRKFNLGNYESLELSIQMFTQVDEDEDPEAVAQFLWMQARDSVKLQAEPILKKAKNRVNVKYNVNSFEELLPDLGDCYERQ